MKEVMVKLMIRKMVVLFLLVLIAAPGTYGADEASFKLINALNYHKSMFNALKPSSLVKFRLGESANSIGVSEQDEERYTAGVPFAFRATAEGNVWILDSANKALKLFSMNGSLLKNLSLSKFGPVIRDFAFAEKSGFWLLNPVDGFIYRTDLAGKLVSNIEGFSDARAIEVSDGGELLVDMPTLASVLRFGKNETLKEQYECDESLSLIEGTGGKLLGLEMHDRQVELFLRNLASPAQKIVLAKFPLNVDDPTVTYAGAEILGKDAAGNLYLNLTACNEDGAIYRDRLYRCTVMGKILAQTDILVVACLAPDLPRQRVVTADGQVMCFYLEPDNYVLALYRF